MAGFTDRENKDPEALPAIEHPEILTKPRHARSAAGAPSGRLPGPLAGDRHPVLLDTGAVVASWLIEHPEILTRPRHA